tara:strand:+ start:144 stop:935 length:792 start_codon:yes stop_codon:yes gene_type:complete
MKVNIIIIYTLIFSIPAFAGLDDLFNKRIEQVENKEKNKQEKKPEPKKEAVAEETPAPASGDISDMFEQAQTRTKIEILEQITAKSNELAELLEAMVELKKLQRFFPDDSSVEWIGQKELPTWNKEKHYPNSILFGYVKVSTLNEEKGTVTGVLQKGIISSVGSLFGKKEKQEPYTVVFNLPDNVPLDKFRKNLEFSIYTDDRVFIDHVDHKNRFVYCSTAYLTIDGFNYSTPSQIEIAEALKNGDLRAKKLESEISSLKGQI